jgi:SpoVK/Ycf46/Vps4 family AAA+-type ATPase
MPNEGRRLAFLNYYLSRRTVDLDGVTTQQLARQTAGLNLKNLEDILLESVAAGSVTVGRVKAAKDRIIASSYSEIAEMLEPLDGGLDALGGMDDLKRFMTNRIVTPINDGRLQHVTKGLLLVGPPGTGKTYAVRALAGSVGYNVVSLKAENIQSSLVGASERALKRFFAFSIALAPTIIFIDEIDQGNMGKRATNDNNPVAGNLFNQVLQFMSDETLRGRVIVIAASNRPDMLDPALMRPGRMDAIVPVMLPEYGDRKLIAVSAAKGFGATITPDALDALAQNTDRYSAADIASIMRDATWSGKALLMVNDVIDAVDDHQSNTADKADWYESLAIAACNKKSLLPARFRALANDRVALTAQIKATAPSNEEYGLRGPREV